MNNLLNEALNRIRDLLARDDGQAHKEARKFLERVEASQAQAQQESKDHDLKIVEQIKVRLKEIKSHSQDVGNVTFNPLPPATASQAEQPTEESVNKLRDLADQCKVAASCLTYNGARAEAVAKHLLLEASQGLRRSQVQQDHIGDSNELAKHQPCGCVICTCEHETQCQGCGAKHCGTHAVGNIPNPVYLQSQVQKEPVKQEKKYLVGLTVEDGCVHKINWHGRNPYSFPVGTKFFAIPPAPERGDKVACETCGGSGYAPSYVDTFLCPACDGKG